MSRLIQFNAAARAKLAELHSAALNASFDRTKYGSASEIGGCARKATLNVTNPPFFTDKQQMVFERGHVFETVVEGYLQVQGFTKIAPEGFPAAKGPCYVGGAGKQLSLIHPEYPVGCNIDFAVKHKDGNLFVIETKTTDGIPDEPYGSWVEQLHTQIGLLHLAYPEAEIRGSILARDLNKGMEREFNGYSYNEQLFEYVLGKGVHIALAKHGEIRPSATPGPLCGFCDHRKGCPAHQGAQPLPHEVTTHVEKLIALNEQKKRIETELEQVKNELLYYTGERSFRGEAEEVALVVTKVEDSMTVDGPKLKKEYPDIYGEVTKKKSGFVKVEAKRLPSSASAALQKAA